MTAKARINFVYLGVVAVLSVFTSIVYLSVGFYFMCGPFKKGDTSRKNFLIVMVLLSFISFREFSMVYKLTGWFYRVRVRIRGK